ncbi:hypothetical protein [Thalassospira alkalitolerans]|mgnify:CR=1 FL=1|uniref:COG4648 family protein n=1 Tax=Thalassospira alkalitolerans TaxID=1293890 RepID=UPI0030EE4DD1|tara:strand:- start:68881 stop:69471 length:591 start_codon:yes stop_codon:yes gene_type:complete
MSWSVPKRITSILLAILGVTYPVLVYFGLSAFSPRVILIIALFLVILRAAMFAAVRRYDAAGLTLLVALILALAGIASDMVAIQFYPVIVNLTLATVFTVTLFSKAPMIERFARMKTPDLDDYAIGYTRILTKVWIGFFIANAAIASWTALYASLETWTLYNGLISYLLIATLFVGEWPIRRILRARHHRNIKENT